MFHSAKEEVSRKHLRLLKTQKHPVEAVKTFASKVSALFHRHATSARQRYRQKLHQFEEIFPNASKGEAGLIYTVPNIPANITPAELASAFNDTLTRLCNESEETQFSSTLTPNSSDAKDLLDFENEKYPPTPSPPQTKSSSDLLLPGLSDSFTAVESHLTSQASIDDLLCRHGLDGLQAPLLPSTRQTPAAKTSEEALGPEQAPPDPFNSLESLTFQGLSPDPLVTKAKSAVKRALVRTRAGILDTGNKKTLLRMQARNNLRKGNMENLAKDNRVATPTSHPHCLQPSPSHIHRTEGSRPLLRSMPARTYTPSTRVSSPYTAYQPSRALLPPVACKIVNTLMEEMRHELDKVLAVFDNTGEEEGIQTKATREVHRQDHLLAKFPPIVPLRISSWAACKTSGTTPRRTLCFKDRLADASRCAILAAAEKAETSELRWLHCRT
jgi:hypothetical protein